MINCALYYHRSVHSRWRARWPRYVHHWEVLLLRLGIWSQLSLLLRLDIESMDRGDHTKGLLQMINFVCTCRQFIVVISIFRKAMYCVCSLRADAATKPNELGLVPGSFMATIWWIKSKSAFRSGVSIHNSLSIRLVHSFTCSGMTPTKFMNFSKFAGLGIIGSRYIRKGINYLLF